MFDAGQTTWVSLAAEVKEVATNLCAHHTVGVRSSVCTQCIMGMWINTVLSNHIITAIAKENKKKNLEMYQNITEKLFLTRLCSLWLSGSHCLGLVFFFFHMCGVFFS